MAHQALQVMVGQISLGIVDLSSNIFETTSSIISLINYVREAHVQSVCMDNSSRLSPNMGHDANFGLGKAAVFPADEVLTDKHQAVRAMPGTGGYVGKGGNANLRCYRQT